jgi:S-DNA-T family DNA segregation ATPase FtsK/SpoIIIE
MTELPIRLGKQKVANPRLVSQGGLTEEQDVTVDLASLPHLLVAGTTGSGKSVFLNSVILQLLDIGPEIVKLTLVDPKRVEFMPYRPLTTVYVQPQDVVAGLQYAERVMEERFELLDRHRARDIAQYNAERPLDDQLWRWVIVIDELAALVLGPMGDEISLPLTRIAQMSRAAGIHLVIATQRPTTNVVTGLLKANIPARVTFAVNTRIDSMVIIDQPGAEGLNGKGDMLALIPGQRKLTRLQGDFVSLDTVEAAVSRYTTEVRQ